MKLAYVSFCMKAGFMQPRATEWYDSGMVTVEVTPTDRGAQVRGNVSTAR